MRAVSPAIKLPSAKRRITGRIAGEANLSRVQDKHSLDLPGVIIDVVEQMTKKSAEKFGEHLGHNFAEYFVSAAAATAAGSIIGVGLGALMKRF